MDLSITYISSQILVVIYYLIYSGTFQLKEKNKILFFGIFATLLSALSYFLLQAYTGIAMCFVAIIRNIWFSKTKSKKSLIIIYLITLLLSIAEIIKDRFHVLTMASLQFTGILFYRGKTN